MFRNLMLYSLIITQLLILKVSDLIKDIIKTLDSLKVYILMMVFHAFSTIKKSLIFKYKFSLTHVLKTVRQLSSSLIYLTRLIKMTFVKIISSLMYFQK